MSEDANEINEPQETEEQHFLDSLCAQLQEVRALKQTYLDEDKEKGHEPSWRNMKFLGGHSPKADPRTLEVRNAPCLTDKQCDFYISFLQPGALYKVEELCVKWNTQITEVRRKCFWMRRKRYIQYIRSHDGYAKI